MKETRIETELILHFICEEVTRQGHDPNIAEDGAIRVSGMFIAWLYAVEMNKWSKYPTISDINRIANMIEPQNMGTTRVVNVRVGNSIPPSWEKVPKLLDDLFFKMGEFTPDEFYVEFQKIHPFVDGNGRTGKILHNWLLGTLDNPELIKDYFGGGNP